MEFEESSLHGRYDLVTLGVAGGTQISSRTSAVLAKLHGDGEKTSTTTTTIVALTAPSKAASKLISIVEIAKRELLARGQKVYQYNALGSRMSEIPRRTTHVETVVAAGNPAEQEEEESDEDAFEVMGGGGVAAAAAAASSPGLESEEMKKRNLPTLKIYLSTVSVKELKFAFGEQT